MTLLLQSLHLAYVFDIKIYPCVGWNLIFKSVGKATHVELCCPPVIFEQMLQTIYDGGP